jgi:hypothetical protein
LLGLSEHLRRASQGQSQAKDVLQKALPAGLTALLAKGIRITTNTFGNVGYRIIELFVYLIGEVN